MAQEAKKKTRTVCALATMDIKAQVDLAVAQRTIPRRPLRRAAIIVYLWISTIL